MLLYLDKNHSQEVHRLKQIAIEALARTLPYQCQLCEKWSACPEVWDNYDNGCWHQENPDA
jgi:hypothetical protein